MTTISATASAPGRVARNPIPFVSMMIAQVLWLTWYVPAIFTLIGGTRTQILLAGLWLVSLVAFRRSAPATAIGRLGTRGPELAGLALFVVVNLVFYMIGKGSYTYAFLVKSILLCVIWVTSTVQLTNDHRRYMQVGVTITLVLGVIALVVLPIIYLNPGIARVYEYQTNQVTWFGSYGFFMSYALALPCLFAIAHELGGRLRIVLYLLCVAMVVLVMFSTFAASVIMVAAGFGALALMSIRKRSTFITIGVVLLLAVVAVTQVDISQIPQLEAMRVKLIAIFSVSSDRWVEDPNSAHVRAHLTAISIRTFVANPFFGVGAQDPSAGDILIGNHSGIIDGLAEFGVFGLAPYLMVLAVACRRLVAAWRRDKDSLLNQARLVTFALYLLGSMVNPTFFDAGICTLLFLLALSPLARATSQPAVFAAE